MIAEISTSLLGTAGGFVGGGVIMWWLFRRTVEKVDKMVEVLIKLDTTLTLHMEADSALQKDVRSNREKVVLLERDVGAAHRRLDEYSQH